MKLLRAIGLGAAVAAAILCSSHPTLASAPIRNLHSALLVRQELPAGVSNKGFAKFYSRFEPSLTVTSGRARASCTVPPYLFAGWVQGLIQDWPRAGHAIGLTECAFLLDSAARTHNVYLASRFRARVEHSPMAVPVPVPQIGDEVFAIKLHLPKVTTFILTFRHANALITLTYSGPRTSKLDALVSVARAVNGRLR